MSRGPPLSHAANCLKAFDDGQVGLDFKTLEPAEALELAQMMSGDGPHAGVVLLYPLGLAGLPEDSRRALISAVALSLGATSARTDSRVEAGTMWIVILAR